MTLRAVLFDLDETLLDRTGSLRLFLAEQHARYSTRLGDADATTWVARFLELDESGMVAKSLVYPRLLAEFRGDPAIADQLIGDYRLQSCAHATPMQGMARVLHALRAAGLKLGIVSNGETDFQYRNIRALGLAAFVNTILISQQEGVRKPESAIFLRAASRLGALPEDCLFVGDNPIADILGARDAGMRTAWLSHGRKWPAELGIRSGSTLAGLDAVLPLALRGTPQQSADASKSNKARAMPSQASPLLTARSPSRRSPG